MKSTLSPDAELERDLARSMEVIDLWKAVNRNARDTVVLTLLCGVALAGILAVLVPVFARLSALEQAQPAAQVEGE